TDSFGARIDHLDYAAFGKLTESNPGVNDRYGFQGRETDTETGLGYFRGRYVGYDTGRFLSQDPAGFGAGDPNLYRFVGNNPANNGDPSGLSRIEVQDLPDGRQGVYYIHTNWVYRTALDLTLVGFAYTTVFGSPFDEAPVWIGNYETDPQSQRFGYV